MNFNINDEVRVKLTPKGMEILRGQHRDLADTFPGIGPFCPPEVDDDGLSKFQMWVLMQTFGPYMSLGFDPPFETVIVIEETKPTSPISVPA